MELSKEAVKTALIELEKLESQLITDCLEHHYYSGIHCWILYSVKKNGGIIRSTHSGPYAHDSDNIQEIFSTYGGEEDSPGLDGEDIEKLSSDQIVEFSEMEDPREITQREILKLSA